MKRYIWLLLILLGILPELQAQYVNIVCAGDTGVVYRVKGTTGSTFVWNVEGGTIATDWGDSISVNWGDREGLYTIRVQEFSQYGCPALPVTASVKVSAPDIDLGDDTGICAGESIEILPEGTFYSYLWQDGSTGPSFIASNQGYVSVAVTDEYGCSRSDRLYLTVHPLPDVDLGPDTSLCGIESILLDAGSDGVNYLWSTGDISQEVTAYAGQNTIWARVTDEYTCTSSDTVVINACSVDERFKDMPTAFTPNGDGQNDVWNIPQLAPFPQAVIEIYDRWGDMIWRSEPGYSDPWDGVSINGREMPMDSYYFIIDLNDGESEPFTGTVTLIK
ncbi:MAG TPA: gliding motility-associated C-terminal domain-containing protein [Bacteroidales bacterium]|nr:gliding motility-associated C-terminal domain-containing protein [Bacteroidales bacterium]